MMPPREQLIAYLESIHPTTVLGVLGAKVASYDPVTVTLDVHPGLFQPAGQVHGGVFVTIAESAASTAAAFEIDITEFAVMGMEVNANHLRAVRSGTIRAIPSLLYKGSTTMVYHIDVLDEQDRRVCVSRCTIAVRPWKGGLPAAART